MKHCRTEMLNKHFFNAPKKEDNEIDYY